MVVVKLYLWKEDRELVVRGTLGDAMCPLPTHCGPRAQLGNKNVAMVGIAEEEEGMVHSEKEEGSVGSDDLEES